MKKWASLAITLFVMGLIFYFSAQDGTASHTSSDGVIALLRAMFGGSLPLAVEQMVFVVRKAAHVLIFMALGMSLFFTVRAFCPQTAAGKQAAMALAFSVLYACTDEFHQSFVPGRTAQIADVGIDTMGACIGIAFLWAAMYVLQKIKHNPRIRR